MSREHRRPPARAMAVARAMVAATWLGLLAAACTVDVPLDRTTGTVVPVDAGHDASDVDASESSTGLGDAGEVPSVTDAALGADAPAAFDAGAAGRTWR